MSDQELPYPRLQRSALDIFDGLGAIAEQTGSEVLNSLGQLALYAAEHGIDDEAQEWLDRLIGATERIQRALHKISTALDTIPDDNASIGAGQEPASEEEDQGLPSDSEVDTGVESPEPEAAVEVLEPEQVEVQPPDTDAYTLEPDALQEQSFADAATDETSLTETPSVEIPTQEPRAVQPEKLPEIPELQLSSYELEVLRRVVRYLSQFEDRQSLKVIIREVFGRSRLSRDGEGRLIQILDAYTEAGRLRSYGRTYGYKTDADLRAATTVEIAGSEGPGEVIDEDDRAMLSYIVLHAQNGEMNIGEIIRRHIGIEVLPRPQHLELMDKLNRLAGLGYLVHAPGSPWYGVGPKLQLTPQQEGPKSRWQDRRFPQLEHIPLPLLPDEAVELQAPAVDETAEPVGEVPASPVIEADPATPTESEPDVIENEPIVLDEVMQALLEALMTGQVFRMEDLRKSVPVLKAMEKEEYDAFKAAFARNGKAQVEAYLLQEGTRAKLHEDGKARGKKYWLEGKDVSVPDTAQPDTNLRVRVSSVVMHPSQGVDYDHGPDDTAPDVVMPDFFTDASGEEVMTMEPIDRRRILSHIAAQEAKLKIVGLKMPAVIKMVADRTGWPFEVAVKVVRAFYKEGDLRVPAHRPHKKGSRILTTQPVEALDEVKAAPNEAETLPRLAEKDDVKKWTAEDTQIAVRVLDALLGLQHVQQGKEPKDLEQELGISEESSKAFRWTLHKMKRRGLVIIETANPNTRSDHSKKIYVPHVKLADQKFKKEWKDSRQQVIDRMKSFEVDSESVTE